MQIRRPKYLDVDLIRDLLDYLGIDSPAEIDVTTKTSSGRRRGLALATKVEARREGTSLEERSEQYSRPVGPVQLLSRAIAQLEYEGILIQPAVDSAAVLTHRAPIEIDGHLALSPASEIAQLFEALVPLLGSGALKGAAGQGDFSELLDRNPGVVAQILGFEQAPRTAGSAVMTLDVDDRDWRFAMILHPRHLYSTESFDDLEGYLTVFGVLDRVLGEGETISLERYLFPGMNRALRRVVAREGLQSLLDSIGNFEGRSFQTDDLNVSGPGGVISVGAIYP